MLFCSSSQAIELQGREAELKRQEAFYKEQLARIERKVRLSCLLFVASEYWWDWMQVCVDPKSRETRSIVLKPGTVSSQDLSAPHPLHS